MTGMNTEYYQPYMVGQPQASTSSPQAVFAIRLPAIKLPTGQIVPLHWPEGATIVHTLDGNTETFEVPTDQHDSVVYLAYHELEVGNHTWSAKVKGQALQESSFGPIEWTVVDPEDQTANSAVKVLELKL